MGESFTEGIELRRRIEGMEGLWIEAFTFSNDSTLNPVEHLPPHRLQYPSGEPLTEKNSILWIDRFSRHPVGADSSEE